MKQPVIGKDVFIAPDADVLDDVTLGNNVSIWYHAVVRGDRNSIIIGDNSNIQDNAVVHVSTVDPVVIGKGVTVGHSAIVHGCEIGDNTLVGMGAIVMNGAKVGTNCIIGAGALVTEGKEIPDGSLVVGVPGKIIGQVSDEQIAANKRNADLYVQEAHDNLSR